MSEHHDTCPVSRGGTECRCAEFEAEYRDVVSAPSPDAASVKPACPWCGSEMRLIIDDIRGFGACDGITLYHYKCASCLAASPMGRSQPGALALATANRSDELFDYLEAVCRQRGIEMRAPEDYENYKLAMAASIALDDIEKRDALTAALAAAPRPARVVRELTDEQMEECVQAGVEILDRPGCMCSGGMSHLEACGGTCGPLMDEEDAIRAAVARALAIVRGET